ncbi:hypothetical protein ABPG72_010436 [Tetrahymena utriculariae]
MRIQTTLVFLFIIFKTIRQIYSACDVSCKTCSAPAPNNCITCTDSSKFVSVKLNNSCVSSCSTSEYIDTSNPQQKYCKQCQPTCKTCSSPLDFDCLSCAQGYFVQLSTKKCFIKYDPSEFLNSFTKKCIIKCDPSEFLNSLQQCQKCDQSCATCKGAGQSDCISCSQNTFYNNGVCYTICPNGYQSNPKTSTCDFCQNSRSPQCTSCYASCQQCTQAQVQKQQCSSCYSGTRTFDSVNNKCLCKNPKDQRDLFYLCSYQNIAILDVQLSGSAPLLTIDFGSPLRSIASTAYQPLSLCQYLFYQATMNLLGSDCQCQITGNRVQVNLEPVDLKLVPGSLKQQTISKYNKSSFQYDILPYSLESNQQFQVSLTLTLSSNNKISTVYNAIVNIETSNLYLQILGGVNQIGNYKKQLSFNTLFRDYEIKDPNAPQKIDFTWTCFSLYSNDNICNDQNNKQIQLQQGSSNITFPENTFQPYTAIKLTVKGQSGSRSSTSKTLCFFNELDITAVQVSFMTAKQNQKINLNELLTFVIQYNSSIPSDTLSYSGAILYQQKAVGNVQFYHQQVKFRIWDYFKNIDPSKPDIYIRFSVYNPQNSIQSLSTIQFQINSPPKNFTFAVDPQQGIALQTVFTIQFLFCIDDDLPLTYQFFYYNSADDLQNELVSPWNILRRQLQDQTLSNSIQTILPQGNLVIMGQAMDSQLGIYNSTVSVQVQSQNKSAEDYYGMIQKLTKQTLEIQGPSQASDQLVTLSVIGENISKNAQFNISQQMSDQQAMLITNIQQISLQLPTFSVLSNFANKIIAQFSQLVFNSQQQNQNSLKNEILKQIQAKIQDTQLSINTNNISYLWQNNDVLMQNLIDSFKILNSTVTLNSQNQIEDYQNYNLISNQIGILLSNLNQPNKGQIVLNGNVSQLLSDKITQKNIYLYGLSASHTGFQAYTELFKNVDKNFTFSKNELISFQVDASNSINSSNSQALLNNQTLIYEFKNAVSSQKYNMTCLQQHDSYWSKKDCNILKKSLNNYVCFCNSQSPTTIIEDIDDVILQNQKLPESERDKGPLNLAYFQELYLHLNIQVLFGVTVVQVILIIIGKYLDRKSFLQKYLQVQQEVPDNGLKSQPSQNSQEIPEIEDFNEPYFTPSNQRKMDSNELENKSLDSKFYIIARIYIYLLATKQDNFSIKLIEIQQYYQC